MAAGLDTKISHGSTVGRALELLGSGVPQESVASALGVTPSYISQLLSDEDFASKVVSLKYNALTKHTERDAKYDALEDTLLTKLDKAVPLILRPLDIMRALKTVNEAKRRGTDSKESIIAQQNIVEITMPTQIVQQFTTNIKNQVIIAGGQDLTTIQSGDLRKRVEVESVEIIEEPRSNQTSHKTKELPNPVIESNTILDLL